ncbi:MAG: glycosyltransferase family 9 protein [Candidatus Hydrogenedentes bacterium]|nr:glycosyltransferase family 9 protein [Candidatus Hydrogenedentota bacterium]
MNESRPRAALQNFVRRIRWTARRALRRPVRIVVEMRWRLGDEIMAIPIYEGIKRRYPFCHLTVWCNYPDVLWRNPHVDSIRDASANPPVCDRYILLRGAPRLVKRIDHYASRADIPIPPMRPRLYYDDWANAALAQHGLRAKEFVAVCTGATWETKRWPRECWQSLCDALELDGQTLVQLGHDDVALHVAHAMQEKTSVREAACMLRGARLLITHDTGLMHLALAVGTPVLALFGPTDPAFLVRDTEALSVLTNGRPCQGCWNHREDNLTEGVCPLGIVPCMGSLTVDSVLARARELFGNGA